MTGVSEAGQDTAIKVWQGSITGTPLEIGSHDQDNSSGESVDSREVGPLSLLIHLPNIQPSLEQRLKVSVGVAT